MKNGMIIKTSHGFKFGHVVEILSETDIPYQTYIVKAQGDKHGIFHFKGLYSTM